MHSALLGIKAGVQSAYDKSIARLIGELFGHTNYQRFAIVGNARTGSNYLFEGLNTSKSIKMHHELFAAHNRNIGQDFDKTLSTMFRKESHATRLVGFKLFYSHLTEEEWASFLAHKDFKIIHLTRENRLRTIVSLDIAHRTGQWARTARDANVPSSDKRVVLEPTKLLARIELIKNMEILTRQRFDDRVILEVVYEKLVSAPEHTFQTISDYLGVHDLNLGKIKLVKQNPEGLEKIIVNYDEISRVLGNTEYAGYLTT